MSQNLSILSERGTVPSFLIASIVKNSRGRKYACSTTVSNWQVLLICKFNVREEVFFRLNGFCIVINVPEKPICSKDTVEVLDKF